MSLRGQSSAPSLPVTAVAWTSNASTCSNDLTLITTTEDGATANFGRGFGRSGYYLCFSLKTDGGMVVSDMQVISEKESTPHGYCYIPEYLEARASVWRKKRVCVRIVPLGTVETAVLDIKLTAKSRAVLPYYTCLGEVHGFVMWYKRGAFSRPPPLIKPRSVSVDIRKLSLDPPAPPKPPKTSDVPFEPELKKLSTRRGILSKTDNLDFCTSAIDGIPFIVHPKFESRNIRAVPSDALNFRIKSVQDIESEYNYPFSVEKKAAKRDPPRRSLASSSGTSPAIPSSPMYT